MRSCQGRLDNELQKLTRQLSVADTPQGTAEFQLLPPFGTGLSPQHKARFKGACGLLTSTFPNNKAQIKESVYRGRNHRDGSKKSNDPSFDACLLAGVWLEGQVVCAASLRLNLPASHDRFKEHVQTIYQATASRFQKHGLGRLLTRCVLRAAAEAGHEYATVVVLDKGVAGYWTKMGFRPSGARDEYAARMAVEESKRHAPKSALWIARLAPPLTRQPAAAAVQEEEEEDEPGAASAEIDRAQYYNTLVAEAVEKVQLRFREDAQLAAAASASAAAAAPAAAAAAATGGGPASEQRRPGASSFGAAVGGAGSQTLEHPSAAAACSTTSETSAPSKPTRTESPPSVVAAKAAATAGAGADAAPAVTLAAQPAGQATAAAQPMRVFLITGDDESEGFEVVMDSGPGGVAGLDDGGGLNGGSGAAAVAAGADPARGTSQPCGRAATAAQVGAPQDPVPSSKPHTPAKRPRASAAVPAGQEGGGAGSGATAKKPRRGASAKVPKVVGVSAAAACGASAQAAVPSGVDAGQPSCAAAKAVKPKRRKANKGAGVCTIVPEAVRRKPGRPKGQRRAAEAAAKPAAQADGNAEGGAVATPVQVASPAVGSAGKPTGEVGGSSAAKVGEPPTAPGAVPQSGTGSAAGPGSPQPHGVPLDLLCVAPQQDTPGPAAAPSCNPAASPAAVAAKHTAAPAPSAAAAAVGCPAPVRTGPPPAPPAAQAAAAAVSPAQLPVSFVSVWQPEFDLQQCRALAVMRSLHRQLDIAKAARADAAAAAAAATTAAAAATTAACSGCRAGGEAGPGSECSNCASGRAAAAAAAALASLQRGLAAEAAAMAEFGGGLDLLSGLQAAMQQLAAAGADAPPASTTCADPAAPPRPPHTESRSNAGASASGVSGASADGTASGLALPDGEPAGARCVGSGRRSRPREVAPRWGPLPSGTAAEGALPAPAPGAAAGPDVGASAPVAGAPVNSDSAGGERAREAPRSPGPAPRGDGGAAGTAAGGDETAGASTCGAAAGPTKTDPKHDIARKLVTAAIAAAAAIKPREGRCPLAFRPWQGARPRCTARPGTDGEERRRGASGRSGSPPLRRVRPSASPPPRRRGRPSLSPPPRRRGRLSSSPRRVGRASASPPIWRLRPSLSPPRRSRSPARRGRPSASPAALRPPSSRSPSRGAAFSPTRQQAAFSPRRPQGVGAGGTPGTAQADCRSPSRSSARVDDPAIANPVSSQGAASLPAAAADAAAGAAGAGAARSPGWRTEPGGRGPCSSRAGSRERGSTVPQSPRPGASPGAAAQTGQLGTTEPGRKRHRTDAPTQALQPCGRDSAGGQGASHPVPGAQVRVKQEPLAAQPPQPRQDQEAPGSAGRQAAQEASQLPSWLQQRGPSHPGPPPPQQQRQQQQTGQWPCGAAGTQRELGHPQPSGLGRGQRPTHGELVSAQQQHGTQGGLFPEPRRCSSVAQGGPPMPSTELSQHDWERGRDAATGPWRLSPAPPSPAYEPAGAVGATAGPGAAGGGAAQRRPSHGGAERRDAGEPWRLSPAHLPLAADRGDFATAPVATAPLMCSAPAAPPGATTDPPTVVAPTAAAAGVVREQGQLPPHLSPWGGPAQRSAPGWELPPPPQVPMPPPPAPAARFQPPLQPHGAPGLSAPPVQRFPPQQQQRQQQVYPLQRQPFHGGMPPPQHHPPHHQDRRDAPHRQQQQQQQHPHQRPPQPHVPGHVPPRVQRSVEHDNRRLAEWRSEAVMGRQRPGPPGPLGAPMPLPTSSAAVGPGPFNVNPMGYHM